jgi:hypothetical protein
MADFFIVFLVVCVIVGLGILAIKLWRDLREERAKARESARKNRELEAQNTHLTSESRRLHAENEHLRPYSKVIDADAYVRHRSEEADQIIAKSRAAADAIVRDAKEEARTIRERHKEKEQEAANSLAYAHQQADRIINDARKEAERIAGSAYHAMEQAGRLEATASAMRDVIEGYGDRYLLNTESWVDELAENWDHKQAGKELQTARLSTKQLIEANLAALCNYAEPNRRQTAIRFVIDAFNGKVDSILAQAKHDNYGTLEKKIRDAYHIVNHEGEAFRNARITQEYLNSRLTELYWVVAARELEKRHREEQQEIKRQMREEEQVRREIERAMAAAEKEERDLNQAMARARAELERAHGDEKAKLIEKLAQLEISLKKAEEKGQRALSMAQQTKRGHVYVISNVGSFGEGVFKIGMTRRLEPLDRVKELGDASVPFSFDVHALIFSEDAPALESEIHRHFEARRVNRVNQRKEFFWVTLHEIKEAVAAREEADVHWTMEAEAQEYRETKAIAARSASVEA